MNRGAITSPKHTFWRVQTTLWDDVEPETADRDVIWGTFVRLYRT